VKVRVLPSIVSIPQPKQRLKTVIEMSRLDDLLDIRQQYMRRLHLLEQQEAYEGSSVDPKVIMEIEDIRARIQNLDAEIARLRSARAEPPFGGRDASSAGSIDRLRRTVRELAPPALLAPALRRVQDAEGALARHDKVELDKALGWLEQRIVGLPEPIAGVRRDFDSSEV
jgi:hypothetical protein